MNTTPGHIAWHDLTVEDAPAVRDFYSAVVGWTHGEVSMGDYADFTMHDASGATVAGVCHARGPNAGLPAQWLMYVNVDDVERAVAEVEAHGGSLVTPIREMGGYRMVVIRDPAGAVLALGSVVAD